ncbi:MAG: hypothetical protein KAS59_06680 [Alphaproteobacteria bacterium]|nr:hypothetical protein [Alphaproteobacteria bacterium]
MIFFKTGLLILFLSMVVTPITSRTAWAGYENMFSNKQQINDPRFPIQDEESFKKNTNIFHKLPFNDTKLEFSIMLPKDWIIENINHRKTSINLNQRFLGDIVFSKSRIINASQATLSIQFISLEREISAENWLKNYANMNNYSINGKVDTISNKRASAYFVFIDNGQIINSYATMQMNRNVAIMMQLKLPIALKEPMKFLQKSIIDSFVLIMATDDPVENQKSFSFHNAMRLSYPESWDIHYPNLNDINNMSAQIHSVTKAGKIEGLIRFIVVRRGHQAKLKDQVSKLKEYFDEFLMLDIKSLVSSDTAPVYDRFLFSRYEVYKAFSKKKGGNEKEIRFVMLGDKEWHILIFLLAPSEEVDLSSWSRDVQTFDLILKNLR